MLNKCQSWLCVSSRALPRLQLVVAEVTNIRINNKTGFSTSPSGVSWNLVSCGSAYDARCFT
jgi:hypothetical protein